MRSEHYVKKYFIFCFYIIVASIHSGDDKLLSIVDSCGLWSTRASRSQSGAESSHFSVKTSIMVFKFNN